MATGVLKLKLGKCLTGPTKRMHDDLKQVSEWCDQARNAMARAWLRWREDHPCWTPPQAEKEGVPQVYKNGEPKLIHPIFPKSLEHEGRELGWETWLYHHGTHAAPNVSAIVISSCESDVVDSLKTRLPKSKGFESFYKWEAILKHEINLDSFRGRRVPVPCSQTILAYDGDCSKEFKPSNTNRISLAEDVSRRGESSCVLKFQLFSTQMNRDRLYHICRLEARQLSDGNKQVLRRIARREMKLQDSEMVYVSSEKSKRMKRKPETGWYLHLTYDQEERSLGLNPENVAVLTHQSGARENRNPFMIAHGDNHWYLGNGSMIDNITRRLNARRQNMRQESRFTVGRSRGHGQKGFYEKTKPITRRVNNVIDNLVWHVVNDVVKFCTRNNCGTVQYQEPSMSFRHGAGWFNVRNVQWDWTRFLARLNHVCVRYGIAVDVTGYQAQTA